MQQPLADARVNHGQDGSFEKTMVAVMAQKQFPATMKKIVTEVATAAVMCKRSTPGGVIGICSPNGCKTGFHRANVCNRMAKELLNSLEVCGVKPFKAQLFAMHDKKRWEFDRVIRDARIWLEEPWRCDVTVPDVKYAEREVGTSFDSAKHFAEVWEWLGEVNEGRDADLKWVCDAIAEQMGTRLVPRQPNTPPKASAVVTTKVRPSSSVSQSSEEGWSADDSRGGGAGSGGWTATGWQSRGEWSKGWDDDSRKRPWQAESGEVGAYVEGLRVACVFTKGTFVSRG